MKDWIVTACDDRAYHTMLVPFIGSLKDIGKWEDGIAVVDLGLSDKRIEKLNNHNIRVIPRSNKLQTIMCDRFSSVADHFAGDDCNIICYDADVWFTSDIRPVKDEMSKGTLTCTHDATWQGFLTNCLVSKDVRFYKTLYENIKQKFGYVLQVGFVAAHIDHYTAFARLQEFLIESKVAHDVFGTDTLNLNVYYYMHASTMNICDTTYNCLPEWGPYYENGRFYIDGHKEIKALHVTSPHRSHGRFSYKRFFPKRYSHWHEILS